VIWGWSRLDGRTGYLVIDRMDRGNMGMIDDSVRSTDRGDKLGGQWVTKRADLELIGPEGEHIGCGRRWIDVTGDETAAGGKTEDGRLTNRSWRKCLPVRRKVP
jgi:hypothetical protein